MRPLSVRLGVVAREARRAAGMDLVDVAMEAGVSTSKLSRFETAARGERFPADTDEIVAAYERVLGLERDELWRRALRAP